MPGTESDLGLVSDIPNGRVVAREVAGQSILLFREVDQIFAVSGTCPHAGAPLIEGVIRDGHVTCPWHKARFCLRSGGLLDPPAVDPLPRHAVRLAGEHVHVANEPARRRPPRREKGSRNFVIVGAGAAGALAAQTLRSEGFAGRIVMIDRDNRVPYDRTLLSKYVLSGVQGGEKSPLQTQSYYADQDIERLTGVASRIDLAARRLFLTDGTSLAYDALLVATGAAAQRPQLPGVDRRQVFLLRSRADAEAILTQAERSQRVVVLGSSFIGMEVAASLRERGLCVTVVGREDLPFGRRFGAPVAQALLRLHQRRGVAFRLAANVVSIDGSSNDVDSVALASGERLPADFVVIGVGVSPETDFANGLRRAEDGGILVDDHLRAADGVYAAGDIACFPYRGDRPSIRVEHWRVAQQQGMTAARNMMGRQKRYDAVPVFWSIQYLKRLDYIGHAEEWDNLVLHGDIDKPEFLLYYVSKGFVVAAAGLDRDQDTAALTLLLSERRHWSAAELGPTPSQHLA